MLFSNNLCPDFQMLGIIKGGSHIDDIDYFLHKSSAFSCIYSNVCLRFLPFRHCLREWPLELDLHRCELSRNMANESDACPWASFLNSASLKSGHNA